MGLLQEQLNRDLPHGRTFHGAGELSEADREVAFYQHGLYFKADGSLARDNPHNKKQIERIEALGRNDAEPAPVLQEPDRQPVNPQVISELEGKSDEEVLGIAQQLVAVLEQQGIDNDYVPVLEDRDENIKFIAKYTS